MRKTEIKAVKMMALKKRVSARMMLMIAVQEEIASTQTLAVKNRRRVTKMTKRRSQVKDERKLLNRRMKICSFSVKRKGKLRGRK